MAGLDEPWLAPKQHVHKVLNTALALRANLDWESGQPANVFLEDGRRFQLCVAPLPREKFELLLRSILDDQQWKTLEETGEVEFLHAPDVGGERLTVEVVTERGQVRVTAHPL